MFGLLEQSGGIKPAHADAMLTDIRALRDLVEDERSGDNADVTAYFVLVHQTLRNSVPETLRKVVKYSAKSNAALQRANGDLDSVRDECNLRAEVWLNQHGVTTNGWAEVDAGEHWGIGVNLDIMVGQV